MVNFVLPQFIFNVIITVNFFTLKAVCFVPSKYSHFYSRRICFCSNSIRNMADGGPLSGYSTTNHYSI